jgi:hypothetical protein
MCEFDQVLAWLRGVEGPCAPPIGIGEFEVLYASPREVVVWYAPARVGHRAGEVAIPSVRLSAAWEQLVAGAALDEPALTALGMGVGGGRWLLAVLTQVPGVCVQLDPLALTWSAPTEPAIQDVSTSARPRRGPRRRSPRAGAPVADTLEAHAILRPSRRACVTSAANSPHSRPAL